MIDSHPAIAISHESEWMVAMGRARTDYEAATGFDSHRFVADVLDHSWAQRVGLSDDVIRRTVDEAKPRTFTNAVRCVFDAYARRWEKPRAGDKTPFYVTHIDLVADILPEGRFVHIIRDGRNVAVSYMNFPFGPKDMRQAAEVWQRRIRAGRASGRRLGAGRYFEVRYEDLIDRPEDRLRELCGFLELDFDPTMLRYYERAEQVVASVRHPGHHTHLFHAPEKGVRDWQIEMSKSDLALFESVSGSLLQDLGYERSAEELKNGESA